MDQLQQALCDMKDKMPTCLADRNILRAALADYLPNNKLQQNLLLNAFDSDVIQSIQSGPDTTLAALNCISQLERDYGMTKDLAFLSIQTWCYILGEDSIATALEVLQPSNQPQTQNPNTNFKSDTSYKIGVGIYRAGTDIPEGQISIQVESKPKFNIYYGIGKNPNRIEPLKSFKDKTYVFIQNGQFLMTESSEENCSFIVKKID